MARFEHELLIDRPPAVVFAYLAELVNLPEWQGGVTEVRPDRKGLLELGSGFTEIRRVAGRRLESRLEVTALDPGRELTLRIVSGPLPGTVRHLLEPAQSGTRLRIVGELTGGGVRALAGPLLERAARREAKADLERLKRVLESG